MDIISNPILLILGGILLALMINLFLVTFAKSKSERNDGSVVNRMLKAAKAPYKETDESLDELARLIEDENLKKSRSQISLVDETSTDENRKSQP